MNDNLNFMHLAERSAPRPETMPSEYVGGREAVTLLIEQFNKIELEELSDELFTAKQTIAALRAENAELRDRYAEFKYRAWHAARGVVVSK